MNYSSSTWKHKLRSSFYSMIPPKFYTQVMPMYYKLFNRKRRGCSYRFKAEENGKVVLYDDTTRFSFMGLRRMNRYIYPDGLGNKKRAMKKKYCIAPCDIKAGDVVVEVGANVGEFTIMAADYARQVFAFEPDPNCFQCLSDNTQSLDNVEIIASGASKANSREVFYISSDDADSSLIKPKIYNQKIEINTVRLDSWMDSQGISVINFLKLEAEGAEMEVLEGLGEKIFVVQKISVDGGPERYGEPTSVDVDRFLRSKGFSSRILGYHVYGWRD